MARLVAFPLVVALWLLVLPGQAVDGGPVLAWSAPLSTTTASTMVLARANGDAVLDPVVLGLTEDPGLFEPGKALLPLVRNHLWSLENTLGRSYGAVVAYDGLGGESLWRHDLVGYPIHLAAGDVDGDGAEELLATSRAYVPTRWYLDVLEPEGGGLRARIVGYAGISRTLAVADLDGDGVSDVALGIAAEDWQDLPSEGRIVAIDGRQFALPAVATGVPPFLLWSSPLTCPAGYGCAPWHRGALKAGDLDGDGGVDLAVLSDYGRLEAFDGATGASRWVVKTGSFANSAVAIHDRRVYAPFDNGLRGVAGDGTVLWEDTRFHRGTDVLVDAADGLVVVGDRNWHILAYDMLDGEVRWAFEAAPPLNHEPHAMALVDVLPPEGPELVVSSSRGARSNAWGLYEDAGVILVLEPATGRLLAEMAMPLNSLGLGAKARDGSSAPEIFGAPFTGPLMAWNFG